MPVAVGGPGVATGADDSASLLGRLKPKWPLVALATGMVVAAALTMYLTRGLTFYYDEWNIVINRQAFTADALLFPHNEHNVMVPILLFKGLWELVGLDGYWAFRLLTVALHLLCVGLLYAYASRRIGPALALAPAAVLLFLGTAWEILLWPFEIQFVIPAVVGILALLAVERQNLKSDLLTSGLVIVGLASGSLGLPIAAGISAEILLGPRRLTRLATVIAGPAVLYVLWLRHYEPFRVQYGSLSSVPEFAANQLGSAVAAIAGFEYHSVRVPALVVGLGFTLLIIVCTVRGGVNRPRVVALVVMALSYWGAIALYRPWVADQEPSRYLYAGVLLVLLVAVELARGIRLDTRGLAAVGALVVLAVGSNVDDLRSGAHKIRLYSDYLIPGLGALELTRGSVDPQFRPEPTRAPDIVAGLYFEAVDRWGSPADSPTEMLARTEPAREAADILLVHALRLRMRAQAKLLPGGPAPLATQGTSTVSDGGNGCVGFGRRGDRGLEVRGEVRVPPGGLQVQAAAGPPVQIQLRRFGDSYVPVGEAPGNLLFGNRQLFGRVLLRSKTFTVRGGRTKSMSIRTDASDQPWHATLLAHQRVGVCGLPET